MPPVLSIPHQTFSLRESNAPFLSLDESKPDTQSLSMFPHAVPQPLLRCTTPHMQANLMCRTAGTFFTEAMRFIAASHSTSQSMSSQNSRSRSRANSSRAHTRSSNASSLTLSDCESLFHLPVEIAAQELGVSRPTIARVMRAHGIKRWPFRRVRAARRAEARSMALPSSAQAASSSHTLSNASIAYGTDAPSTAMSSTRHDREMSRSEQTLRHQHHIERPAPQTFLPRISDTRRGETSTEEQHELRYTKNHEHTSVYKQTADHSVPALSITGTVDRPIALEPPSFVHRKDEQVRSERTKHANDRIEVECERMSASIGSESETDCEQNDNSHDRFCTSTKPRRLDITRELQVHCTESDSPKVDIGMPFWSRGFINSNETTNLFDVCSNEKFMKTSLEAYLQAFEETQEYPSASVAVGEASENQDFVQDMLVDGVNDQFEALNDAPLTPRTAAVFYGNSLAGETATVKKEAKESFVDGRDSTHHEISSKIPHKDSSNG